MATSIELPRVRFTVDQYHHMDEAGVLDHSERYELLDGAIITMSPIGPRHAARTRLLNHLFSEAFSSRAIVDTQNPITLGDLSEPQPDVVLLKWRDDYYENQHPEPADVLLMVEIGDTTAELDRFVKMPLYAEGGVNELWLVNLQTDQIDVFRQPSDGEYRSVTRYTRGQRVGCQAFPDATWSVDEILGQP
jgi:Uma2 family endonuclease